MIPKRGSGYHNREVSARRVYAAREAYTYQSNRFRRSARRLSTNNPLRQVGLPLCFYFVSRKKLSGPETAPVQVYRPAAGGVMVAFVIQVWRSVEDST